jgi:hypothetical protein
VLLEVGSLSGGIFAQAALNAYFAVLDKATASRGNSRPGTLRRLEIHRGELRRSRKRNPHLRLDLKARRRYGDQNNSSQIENSKTRAIVGTVSSGLSIRKMAKAEARTPQFPWARTSKPRKTARERTDFSP